MTHDEKEALAQINIMSKEACAIRLSAARRTTGLIQTEFATAAGTQPQALNNMEKARQFPNRDVMAYLYRAHRIDFNFLMNGDFSQLPMDVQDRLFAELSSENSA